jgi:hypothetical protein
MRWFVKIADKWHGDTLDGQLYKRELTRLSKVLVRLVRAAVAGGPESVLPRWRGDVRRSILLLPAANRLPNMSMMELRDLSNTIARIESDMRRYSHKRLNEIVEGGSSCQLCESSS